MQLSVSSARLFHCAYIFLAEYACGSFSGVLYAVLHELVLVGPVEDLQYVVSCRFLIPESSCYRPSATSWTTPLQ